MKLADFRQLAQTRLNATGHWSSVVKRAATVVISFAEIRGLYLAHSVFAHAVLPLLIQFHTRVVDAPSSQTRAMTISLGRSDGRIPDFKSAEQLVEREMKRRLILRQANS